MIDLRTRKIKLENYWPDFLREYLELQTLSGLVDAQLSACLKDLEIVHRAPFVFVADERGLRRYEKMLRIIVPEDATLEDRRVAILARLNTRMPYTKRVLKRFLDNLVGSDGYIMTIDYAERRLTIRIELKRRHQMNAVREMLRKVLPANMVIDLDLRYNQIYMLKKFTVVELKQYTVWQLRNDPRIKELYLERGGVLM